MRKAEFHRYERDESGTIVAIFKGSEVLLVNPTNERLADEYSFDKGFVQMLVERQVNPVAKSKLETIIEKWPTKL